MDQKIQIRWNSNLRKIFIKYDELERELLIIINHIRDYGLGIRIGNCILIIKIIFWIWLRFRSEINKRRINKNV